MPLTKEALADSSLWTAKGDEELGVDLHAEHLSTRVLVVEDDRVNATDLCARLQKLGYPVAGTLALGEDAVARIDEFRPDIILMDVCLGGKMDGIQTAEAIREKHNLPIIFITANSDDATLTRAKSSRPWNFLVKPAKERELRIGIEMALLNHRLTIELQAARDTLEIRVGERTAELAKLNDAMRKEIEVRKRMESQAREQADLLAKARDAIYVCDLGGTISYWNRSAERLYGLSQGCHWTQGP